MGRKGNTDRVQGGRRRRCRRRGGRGKEREKEGGEGLEEGGTFTP